VKRKLKNLDRSVDISTDIGDKPHGQAYGAKVDSTQDPNKLAKSLSLIRRFNRHGALVLGSSYDDENPNKKQKNEEAFREHLHFQDLDIEKDEGVVALKIENARLYFEGRATTEIVKTESYSPKEQLNYFQNEVNNWNSVPESLACTILLETSNRKNTIQDNNISRDNNNVMGSEAELLSLPEDFKEKLYSFFAQANELLRHFWSSFPANTTKLYDKASRIHDSISVLYDNIQLCCKALPLDKRNLGQLMLPIIRALDKAIDKFSSTKKPT